MLEDQIDLLDGAVDVAQAALFQDAELIGLAQLLMCRAQIIQGLT